MNSFTTKFSQTHDSPFSERIRGWLGEPLGTSAGPRCARALPAALPNRRVELFSRQRNPKFFSRRGADERPHSTDDRRADAKHGAQITAPAGTLDSGRLSRDNIKLSIPQLPS